MRSTSAARPTKLDSPAVRGARAPEAAPTSGLRRARGPGRRPARRRGARSCGPARRAHRPGGPRRAGPGPAARPWSRAAARAASWAASASTSGARPSRSASRARSSTTSARRPSSRAAARAARRAARRRRTARGPARAPTRRRGGCAPAPVAADRASATSASNATASTERRVDGQPVAARLRDHQLARQHPAQPRDQRLQGVGGVLRRDLPQAVDERGGADGPPGVQREPGQQPAQADAGQAARPVDGAQHADPHGLQCAAGDPDGVMRSPGGTCAPPRRR